VSATCLNPRRFLQGVPSKKEGRLLRCYLLNNSPGFTALCGFSSGNTSVTDALLLPASGVWVPPPPSLTGLTMESSKKFFETIFPSSNFKLSCLSVVLTFDELTQPPERYPIFSEPSKKQMFLQASGPWQGLIFDDPDRLSFPSLILAFARTCGLFI